jgi:arylformamidase
MEELVNFIVKKYGKLDGIANNAAVKRAHLVSVEEWDLVLLRTGWSQWRDLEKERYVTRNPMLHPEAARYLMESFPNIRGVAIDAASIGAPEKVEPTIETHQILTGKDREDGRFILIFEDLRIDSDLEQASRIYAWPLFIAESDGSPCTIVAEFPPDFQKPGFLFLKAWQHYFLKNPVSL